MYNVEFRPKLNLKASPWDPICNDMEFQNAHAIVT